VSGAKIVFARLLVYRSHLANLLSYITGMSQDKFLAILTILPIAVVDYINKIGVDKSDQMLVYCLFHRKSVKL
jgi:hypothetical protein